MSNVDVCVEVRARKLFISGRYTTACSVKGTEKLCNVYVYLLADPFDKLNKLLKPHRLLNDKVLSQNNKNNNNRKYSQHSW